MSKRVAIVGAGIGGLTLGNLLGKFAPAPPSAGAQGGQRLFDVNIYERDEGRDSRGQGYSISLRGDMGLKALRACGFTRAQRDAISQPVRKFSFLTAGGWRLMTLGGGSNGTTAAAAGQQAPPPPPQEQDEEYAPYFTARVDRRRLRELLLAGIGDRVPVHYGKEAVRFDLLPASDSENGPVRITFRDGTTTEADVVVACDGSRSKLRRQMLGDKPLRHGVTLINGRVPDAAAFETQDLNRHATMFVLGTGTSFFTSTNEAGGVGWSLGVATPLPCAFDDLSNVQIKAVAASKVAGWVAEPVRKLVEATDPTAIAIKDLKDIQLPPSARRGHVVLLGDAAHPMTPYMGLGANTAMADAERLAACLRTELASDPELCGAALTKALDAYDQQMLAAGGKAVDGSRKACRDFHTTGTWALWCRNAKLWLLGWMLAALSRIPKRK